MNELNCMYVNGYDFSDEYFDAWIAQEYFVWLEFDAFNCFGV